MNNYTNLNSRQDLLDSITALEKELAAKTEIGRASCRERV